jgi:hypothetical protein
MKFKVKIIVLSSIFLVLVLTLILGTVFSPERRLRRLADRPLIPEFDAEAITSLSIQKEDETILLEQPDKGVWHLLLDGKRFPADQERVQNLLNALKNSNRGTSVSENPEEYENFQLGPKAAVFTVSTSPETPDHVIFFGKSGAGRNESYIRYEGGDTVFLSDTSAGFYINQGSQYYSDLLMAPEELTAQDVQRISVPDFTIIRTADGEGWMFGEETEEELDGEAAEDLASALAALRAQEFAVSLLDVDRISEKSEEITFLTGSTETVTYTILGAAADNKYLAESSVKLNEEGYPYRYLISEYTYNRIMKSREEILVKAESKETAE